MKFIAFILVSLSLVACATDGSFDTRRLGAAMYDMGSTYQEIGSSRVGQSCSGFAPIVPSNCTTVCINGSWSSVCN